MIFWPFWCSRIFFVFLPHMTFFAFFGPCPFDLPQCHEPKGINCLGARAKHFGQLWGCPRFSKVGVQILRFRVEGLGFRVKEAFNAAVSWLAFIPPSQIPTTSDDAHSRKEKEKEKEIKKKTRKRKRKKKKEEKKNLCRKQGLTPEIVRFGQLSATKFTAFFL